MDAKTCKTFGTYRFPHEGTKREIDAWHARKRPCYDVDTAVDLFQVLRDDKVELVHPLCSVG